ncbi:MAG: isoprenylcysteine carboxylmethyltransferase family protein [Acidobacteriia bacterium]|nr:isoprenylcysteine carboxylmethyltransferase family protein [Terriglobia bacterium]
MHLVDPRLVGIAMLVVLGALVTVKRAATGSIMRDTPTGGVWLWVVHVFNLFFLLVVNPLAAILLLTRRFEAFDPTHVTVAPRSVLVGLETAGALLYLAGFALMGWALMALRASYQAGGTAPRAADEMTTGGPYRLVRHPMYTAALSISLGLACVVQSLACLSVFCVYVGMMICLIPFEEAGLRQAYGERYAAYRREVHCLVPFLL